MSSPIRVEERFMTKLKRMGIAALAGAVIGAAACVVAQAQDAPHGDAGNGKRIYLAVGVSPVTAVPDKAAP
jgi:hypothetical protein